VGELDVETPVRRYWLRAEQFEGRQIGDHVRIDGDELHHIRDVCRLGKGDRFEVLSAGKAYLVEGFESQKRLLVAKILSIREIPQQPRPHLHLVLSIPRFPVFESVLEKCVELGVASVQPVFSERSYLRQNLAQWREKGARFQKIIISACQQSGRGELMSLEPAVPLIEIREKVLSSLDQSHRRLAFFAYEGGVDSLGRPIPTTLLSSAIQLWKSQKGSAPLEDIWLFVGGEGGFSVDEVDAFRDLGCLPVSLGDHVLRVETACVSLISIVFYEFRSRQVTPIDSPS
jgi:16S rRNA (uracil1498-N3)-methyltransferase